MRETIRYPKPAILERLTLDEHAVIEASAGTGKTYTIEHLIVDILLNADGDVRIDDILVVTFTRRATAELKQRVRAMLHRIVERAEAAEAGRMGGASEVVDQPAPDEPHWEIGPEGVRDLREALYDFDRASIYTIHGFCQRILTEYAFTNRRLFREEHADAGRIFEQCFWEVLRRRLSVDAELQRWLRAWMVWEPGVDSLRDALEEEVGSQAALRPVYDDAERRQMLEAVEDPDGLSKKERKKLKWPVKTAALRRLAPVVEEALRDFKRREGVYAFDDMLRLVWESLQGERGGELVGALRESYQWALVDEFQDTDPLQWKIFERIFFESGGENIFYLIGDPKQAIYGFRGADVGTYIHAAQTVTEPGGQFEVLERNYRSTPALIGAYNQIFDQQGDPPYFDAGEIQYDRPVDAGRPERRLLGPEGQERPAVELMELTVPDDEKVKVGALRRAFREEIADEIARLLKNGKAGGGAGGGTGGLVVRQGSETAEEPGEESETPVGPSDIFVLTTTRRRGEEIGEALERRGIRHAFYRKEGLFQTDQARHILEVLQAVARPRDRSRRLKAYLTPLFGVSLEEVERADAAEGAGAPRAMLERWHRMADRRDFERLFHRMLEDSGLIRRSIFLEESDRALTNYQHIFEILTEQAHRADCHLEELVLSLRRYIEGEAEPEGEDANLQRLESDEDAVQIMTVHKSKGLEAEVVFLYGGFGRSRNAALRLESGPEEARQSGAGEADGPPSAQRFLVRKLMDEEQKTAADRHYERESQRLMYVALTRAGARLYLPYMPPKMGKTKRSSKVKGRYTVLLDRLDAIVENFEAWPETWFGRRAVRPTEVSAVDRSSGPGEALEDWQPPQPLEDRADEVFERYRRSRKLRITSYTSLASDHGSAGPSRTQVVDAAAGVGREDGGDAELQEQTVAEGGVGPGGSAGEDDEEAEAVLPAGRHTGIALHRLLEVTDYENVAAAGSLEAWRREVDAGVYERTLRDNGLDAALVEAAQTAVWRALRAPVELPAGPPLEGGLARAERHEPELPFFYPIPEGSHPELEAFHDPSITVDEGYVQGEIDLLIEHDGRIYFVDWKSNQLDDYAPEAVAEDVQTRYEVQIELYTLAVARMFGLYDAEGWERRFGGYLYAYVRGMNPEQPGEGVHVARPDWQDVVDWWGALRDRRWT